MPDRENPEWIYDPVVETGYLRFSNEKIARTRPASRLNLDLDDQGEIIGVEVFL